MTRVLLAVVGAASSVTTTAVLIASSTPTPAAAAPLTGGIPAADTGNQSTSSTGSASSSLGTIDPAVGDYTGLRTQSSQTFPAKGGTFKTDVSNTSLNFKTNGAWQPIDDTLVASSVAGEAFENRANSYMVQFPSNLSSPVTFTTSAGATVGYALAGASATPSAKGDAVTYANALTDTTVAYSAQPDSVVDTLTLASSAAPSNFTYDVTLPAGASMHQAGDGAIDITASDGTAIGSFAPPSVSDASGPSSTSTSAVSMSLSGPSTITVAVDPSWLDSSARRWPVTVDPSLNDAYLSATATYSCTITSSTPTTSACGGTSETVGYSASSTQRALLKFPLIGVPLDATVLNAEIALELSSDSSSSATPVSIYRATDAYTGSATWNTYDGTHSWTTAGGDYSTAADSSYTLSTTASLGTGIQYTWSPTALVQNWLDGNYPNDGVVVRETNENSSYLNSMTFNTSVGGGTELIINWANSAGAGADATQYTQSLDDRLTLNVNPATGNLMLAANDLSVKGVGENLAFERFFNSLDAGATGNYQSDDIDAWDWTGNYTDSYITRYTVDGSAAWEVGDGSYYVFPKNSDTGSLMQAPGLNATLAPASGTNNWTLTFNQSQTVYHFTSNYLTSIVDRNGDTILVNQSGSSPGELTSLTDTEGRSFPLTYNSSDQLTKLSDTSGSRSLTYAENTSTGLQSVKDAASQTTTYGYDSSTHTQVQKVTTPNGTITTIAYNSAGQVTSFTRVTNPTSLTGYTWSFSYHPDSTDAGGYTVMTDPNSHTTTWYYNDRGAVTQTKNGLGNEETNPTTFNANGDPVNVYDDAGVESTTGYDTSNGMVNQTTGAAENGTGDGTNAFTYSQYNTPTSGGSAVTGGAYLPSSSTDTEQNCSDYTYDAKGNETITNSGIVASGNDCSGATGAATTSQNAYQGDVVSGSTVTCGGKTGELCWTEDGNGQTTNYLYFSDGDLEKVTPPSPESPTSYTYDADSRVKTSTDGDGNVTTYTYDGNDRVTQTLTGSATSCTTSPKECAKTTFDGDGLASNSTDGNNQVTYYYYDDLNRQTQVKNPLGYSTYTGYDGVNKTSTTDGDSNVTNYAYDAANELLNVTLPGGSCTGTRTACLTYTYDVDGRVTSYKDENANVYTYHYDSAGGNDWIALPGGSCSGTIVLCEQFTYYNSGNTMTSENTDGATTTSTYDHLGRVSGASTTPTGSAPSLTYGYDSDSNMNLLTVGSTTTHYGYDADDNMCWEGSGTSTGCTGPSGATGYTYDGAGNVHTIEYPNGSTVTDGYDQDNRLSSVLDWNSHTTHFTYDGDSNLATITYPNGIVSTYTDNAAEQLTSIVDKLSTTTVQSYSYGRDHAGLASSETDVGTPGTTSESYTYTGLNQLKTDSGQTYTYDGAENLATGPSGVHQAFNQDDQLCWSGTATGSCGTVPTGDTSFGYSNEGNITSITPSGGSATTYGWNAANQMTSVTPPTGSATSYTYDDQGLLQSETTGTTTANYTWDTQAGTPLLLSDGTNSYLYGPGTTPIEQISSGGTTSYLLTDQLGSVRGITNTSGSLTGSETYGSWGNTASTSGTVSTPFAYAGGYLDPASGFLYFRARWLDPKVGQWTSIDPDLQKTESAYAYSGNDPTNDVDPDGADYGPYHLVDPVTAYALGSSLIISAAELEILSLPAPILDAIATIVTGVAAFLGEQYVACSEAGSKYNERYHRVITSGGCGIVLPTFLGVPYDVEVQFFPRRGKY